MGLNIVTDGASDIWSILQVELDLPTDLDDTYWKMWLLYVNDLGWQMICACIWACPKDTE
jgi:hypothetical protein